MHRSSLLRAGLFPLAVVSLALVLSWSRVARPSGPAGVSPTTTNYRDSSLPVERRVADLLGRMTLAEKLAQLSAVNWDHTQTMTVRGLVRSP